jgi:hypothetical protein
MNTLVTITLFILAGVAPVVHSLVSYANDFVDPDYIVSKAFSNYTVEAQSTVVQWADELAAQGPWSKLCLCVHTERSF